MILKLLLIFILQFQYMDSISYTALLNITGLINVKAVIPDIQTDIRYASENNFTGAVLNGYEASVALLLPETAAALNRVQANLRQQGLSLKIFDAYRPLRAEAYMEVWAYISGNENLLEEGYVPDNVFDPRRRISHPSGNTVDVTIVDNSGTELDMGTEFDAFTKNSRTMNAEGEVLQNRLFLKSVMEAEGFKNLYAEWWHFSYPDEPAVPRDIVIKKSWSWMFFLLNCYRSLFAFKNAS